MPSQKVIHVKETAQGKTQNGREYLKVTAEEGTFYVWDPEVAKLIKAGENEVVIAENGKFPKIVSVVLEAEEEKGATFEGIPPAKGSIATRAIALRAAAQVLAGSQAEAEDVVQLAETLLAWLLS